MKRADMAATDPPATAGAVQSENAAPKPGATEGESGAAPAPEAPESQQSPSAEEVEAGYLDQLQRLQAEFTNYRRRLQRERAEWDARSKAELIAPLLSVLDDTARARAAALEHRLGQAGEGLLLILSRLAETLRAQGLEEQPTPRGTPFDPEQHEALSTEATDEFPEDVILETLQPGYLFRGLLLRPARVRVSAARAAEAAPPSEPPARPEQGFPPQTTGA
jgi:molecular chaperone GrpE